MAFTYSGDPAASPLDEVRFLIGDTDPDEPILQDAEVLWIIDQQPTITAAAAAAAASCAVWCARQADEIDKKVGETSISKSWRSRREAFEALAARLAVEADTSAPTPWAHPDALTSGFAVGAMDRAL